MLVHVMVSIPHRDLSILFGYRRGERQGLVDLGPHPIPYSNSTDRPLPGMETTNTDQPFGYGPGRVGWSTLVSDLAGGLKSG